MNLNDATIFVFVRNDLPLGQDDIQTDHACFHLGLVVAQTWSAYVPGIPWLITKEKLRTHSIKKLADVALAKNLAYYLMQDDDVDKRNPTALAVLATTAEEKEFFRKYPLRNYAGLAQHSEHPVSNGKVAGEDPAAGSTSAAARPACS